MSAMRTILNTLVLAVLSLFCAPVLAQSTDVLTVHELAFDESAETVAVRVEAGLLLWDSSEDVSFLCASAWEASGAEAEWMVHQVKE